ncbi:MAG TPA: DUF6221 family protein [Pseudonocardia sp.]
MTDDLVAWLREQLDEDERIAREANQPGERWFASGDPSVNLHALTAHAQRWNPARAVAEVEAKRRIIARHGMLEVFGTKVCAYCATLQGQRPGNGYWPCPEILDAALPYADRPGYRDEWRP